MRWAVLTPGPEVECNQHFGPSVPPDEPFDPFSPQGLLCTPVYPLWCFHAGTCSTIIMQKCIRGHRSATSFHQTQVDNNL